MKLLCCIITLLNILVVHATSSVEKTSVSNYSKIFEECEKTLFTRMKSEYRAFDPPPQPGENYSYLDIGIQLVGLQTISEADSEVELLLVIQNSWNDSRLAWGLDECKRKSLVLPKDMEIWFPKYLISNRRVSIGDFDDHKLLWVRNSGYLTWKFFDSIRIGCIFDYSMYPMDETKCTINLYYFDFNVEEGHDTLKIEHILDMTISKKQELFEHATWEVHRTSFGQHPDKDPGNLLYEFTIKRKPEFTVVTMMLPVMALHPLALLAFILPADSGEKMGVSLATLLTHYVLSQSFFDNLPTGKTMPWIGIAFLYLLFTAAAATFFSAAILALHSTGETRPKNLVKAARLNTYTFRLFFVTNMIIPVVTVAITLPNNLM